MKHVVWQSLLVAVLTGAATAIAEQSADGATIERTAIVALVGAIGGVAAFLKQSPIQKDGEK